MKNIVFVPAFKRPEMLFLTLEALSMADQIEEHEVWVIQDQKKNQAPNPGIAEVVKEFESRLQITHFLRNPNECPGNRENYLTSYRVIHQMDVPFCFLVEEDVIVTRDFFRWHYAVMKHEPDLFCSISMAHPGRRKYDDPSLYRKIQGFCCMGVCFRRTSLPPIFEHGVPEYYMNAGPYLLSAFPESHYGSNHGEQDGLVSRIMEREHFMGAFPDISRCFHTGINGYNRREDTRLRMGSWREQARELRERWRDPAWMTADYLDCQPRDLENPAWSHPREIQPVEAI